MAHFSVFTWVAIGGLGDETKACRQRAKCYFLAGLLPFLPPGQPSLVITEVIMPGNHHCLMTPKYDGQSPDLLCVPAQILPRCLHINLKMEAFLAQSPMNATLHNALAIPQWDGIQLSRQIIYPHSTMWSTNNSKGKEDDKCLVRLPTNDIIDEIQLLDTPLQLCHNNLLLQCKGRFQSQLDWVLVSWMLRQGSCLCQSAWWQSCIWHTKGTHKQDKHYVLSWVYVVCVCSMIYKTSRETQC
jgi:hypothetical protein